MIAGEAPRRSPASRNSRATSPTSPTPEEAGAHFGGPAVWVAGSGPASSERTRAVLGWAPRERGLIADIDRPDYYA